MNGAPHRCFYIFWTLLGAIAAVATSGCATSTLAVAETGQTPAHVVVANRTDYTWKLTFALKGQVALSATLLPRQTVDLALDAGEYRIEQSVVGGTDDSHLAQALTERFEEGRTYRWPMVTLLSDATTASF